MEPPPDEVRDRLAEIFRRAEFQRRPTWWDRASDQISEWLERLLGGSDVGASGASWGGPVAELILWIVIVVLVVGLVALVAVVVARRVRRSERTDDSPEVRLEEDRSVREWGRLAAQHERDGSWKEAIRCRHRELVGTLAGRGVVSSVPGRTTGELRSDVAEHSPAAASAFSEATLLFELPWYADRPTGPEENARFRSLAAEVVARPGSDVAPGSAPETRPSVGAGAGS